MGWIGTIWTLLKALWAGFKEADTIWDVLGLFGWRTAVMSSVLLLISGLDAAMRGIRWYHFIGLVIATSFIILGIAGLIQPWLKSKRQDIQKPPRDGPKGRRPLTEQDGFEEAFEQTQDDNVGSPFSIEFQDHPAGPYFTGGDEHDQRTGGNKFVQRYKLLVGSEADISNVQVEVVRWTSASAYGKEDILEVAHHALRFEDGSLRTDFASGDRKWVPIVKFVHGSGVETMEILLEGFPEPIMQRQVEHRLKVRVSAVGAKAYVKCFSVRVQDYDVCIMKNAQC